MKKYYSYKYIKIAALALLFIPFGCDDFLDKPLQGTLTQDAFPTTASDAERATNAMYNTLRNSGFNFGLFPILDIMSDDGHKGSEPTDARATIGPYDNFTHIGTEGTIGQWWKTLYLGIKRTNIVIEKVAVIEMDTELRNRYIGEAYFLRALFYLDLVRAWGKVPKVTTVDVPLGLQRAEVAEIHALIEADLMQAITLLWEKDDERFTANDLGRATKGAAQALLARYYLWIGDFPNAEIYAMAVINSGDYDLENAFGDANSEAGRHGVESVFEIGAIGEENVASGGNQYANVQGVRGTPNRGWGFNRPTEDLKSSFEVGDPRLDSTVLDLGETLDGITIIGHAGTPDNANNGMVYPGFPTGIVEIEAYNQKVWTAGDNVPTQFGYNRRLIRYADVLLMAAEALNENNKTVQAETELNKVRGRVGLTPYNGQTKTALHDIIFNERRHELALEGLRFWDLIRTGRAQAVLGPYGFITGKHELLAVPQAERDLGGLDQNQGWE